MLEKTDNLRMRECIHYTQSESTSYHTTGSSNTVTTSWRNTNLMKELLQMFKKISPIHFKHLLLFHSVFSYFIKKLSFDINVKFCWAFFNIQKY